MKRDIEAAIQVVQEAGQKLALSFGKTDSFRSKSGSAADVVTRLDIDTEKLIEERLMAHDPAIGFAGEESGGRKGTGRYWLLDPIDGTAHFIRGIPFCTTMLALVEDGQVVASVIYNFVTKELYTAQKGKGAELNGKPILVSERKLEESYLFVESNLGNEKNLPTYVALRKKTTIMQTINCGYEYGLIASGKIEGRICFDPYGADWDYAAGSLLVSEAGGVVANMGKDSYDFTNHDFIASNKAVYAELTQGSDALFPLK